MRLSHLFKSFDDASVPIPTVSDDERVYAVGDIHGRIDLLVAMLRAIDKDAQALDRDRNTLLVFLGDYIDRGEQSAQVVDLLMRLSDGAGDRIVCLKGNHEDALIRFLENPDAGRAWLSFGAAQTLASYGLRPLGEGHTRRDRHRLAKELRKVMGPHVAFLQDLPLFHNSGSVVFSHAGMNPKDGRDSTALLWGHKHFLKPNPVPGLRIVHGHYDSANPVAYPGRVCIDTGAYYSGRLTAVRLDTETSFLTVPA